MLGAGNFTLNSSTYNYVGGSVIAITNPDNTPTDLDRSSGSPLPSPSLPNLVLADSTAFRGRSRDGRQRA